MSNLAKGDLVVTGGAGLIGSALIWGLNNRGFENIWLVDSQEPNEQKAKKLSPTSFLQAHLPG